MTEVYPTGSEGVKRTSKAPMDLRLRAAMEREIRELIESSEGGKDWLAEKLMDYFEDNAIYICYH